MDADDSMRKLNPFDRNCYFQDENTELQIHQTYSYINCKLECVLSYTKSQMLAKYSRECHPWFLPTLNDSKLLCDPWQSYDFFNILNTEIPDDICSHCLPDCSVTTYEPTINTIPFDDCDFTNVGVSRFCSFNQKRQSPMNERFATQVQNEIIANKVNYEDMDYIQNLDSSIRVNDMNLNVGGISENNITQYDAFDKDIAMVSIVYQDSTVTQIGSQAKMTWIDYLATVGGLLGLVLGMGFISFVELVWLALRIFSKIASIKWIA